ncbi:hypothetical protein ACH5RR_003436 [Cinchona calisaya]|uniref:Uncharacterized protein n=1 Tax=Cinchona calisaya TaxID=153742 RepID=A0ABD3AUV6_9GENT
MNKSMEGDYHRLCNHLLNHNRSIIWMMLFVIAADIILVLFRSTYHNHPSLATSQYSKNSFPTQYFSTGQPNISSLAQDDSAIAGDLFLPKSNISTPAHDDSTGERDLFAPKSNNSSTTHDDSTAESDFSSPSFSSIDESNTGNQSSPTESVRGNQSSPVDNVQGNVSSPITQMYAVECIGP